MRFKEMKRIVKIIRDIFYSVDYNFVLAMGLSLIFIQSLQFIQGKTDEDRDNDALTNNLLIYIGLMVAFVGGIANTSFMLQNWEDMANPTIDENNPEGEEKNTFQKMTKKDIAKAVAITIPPLIIAWGGTSEFLATQFLKSSVTSKIVYTLSGLLVLSAGPGEFFTYGPGLLEKERLAIDAVRSVLLHPKLVGEHRKKAKYIGLLIGQILSNLSDNLPEIFAVKEILKQIFNVLGTNNNPIVGLIVGSIITLIYASFEANNEIGAVFREIAAELNHSPLEDSERMKRALLTITHFDIPPAAQYSLGEKIVANLLTGINCLCYMSASSLFASLIGTLSSNKIPFTKTSHPDTYYLWNSLFLVTPMTLIGGFSAYGQWKTVNPATQERVHRVANAGIKSLLTFGLWRPKKPEDMSLSHLHDTNEETSLLNVANSQTRQYGYDAL